MKKITAILAAAFVFMFCGTVFAAFPPVPAEEINPGFVYIGPVGDGGYTFMHDKGGCLRGFTLSSLVRSLPEFFSGRVAVLCVP